MASSVSLLVSVRLLHVLDSLVEEMASFFSLFSEVLRLPPSFSELTVLTLSLSGIFPPSSRPFLSLCLSPPVEAIGSLDFADGCCFVSLLLIMSRTPLRDGVLTVVVVSDSFSVVDVISREFSVFSRSLVPAIMVEAFGGAVVVLMVVVLVNFIVVGDVDGAVELLTATRLSSLVLWLLFSSVGGFDMRLFVLSATESFAPTDVPN